MAENIWKHVFRLDPAMVAAEGAGVSTVSPPSGVVGIQATHRPPCPTETGITQ